MAFTLKNKLITLVTSIILCFTLMIWLYFVPLYEKTLYISKQEDLRSTTNQMITALDRMITHGHEYPEILKFAQTSRYGKDGTEYFLFLKPNGILDLHPTTNSLNGTDVTKVKDPLGFPLVEKYLEIGKSPSGQGFLSYHWTWFNDPNRIEPKMAYIHYYKPLNIILISTIYTNDIVDNVNKLKLTACIIVSIGVIWSFLFSFCLIRSIMKSINNIKNRLQELNDDHDGNLNRNLNVSSKDELGDIALIFNLFLDKIRNIIMTTIVANKELTAQSKQLFEYVNQLNQLSKDGFSAIGSVENKFGTLRAAVYSLGKDIDSNVLNINEAASASQEISQVITDMTKKTTSTQTLACEVKENVKTIESSLQELIKNHDSMDEVVTVISSITAQTSLLAFTARIENAKSLDTGSGISSVANEMNVLSKESTEATIKINEIIHRAKRETVITITSINNIFLKTIEMVNAISQIASDLEAQSITSVEISKNIMFIDNSIVDMQKDTGIMCKSSDDLKENIDVVGEYFKGIDTLKSALVVAVCDLSSVKDNLQTILTKFRT